VFGGFSLFVYSVSVSYILDQPDGSIVVNDVVFPRGQVQVASNGNNRPLPIRFSFNIKDPIYAPLVASTFEKAIEELPQAIADAEVKEEERKGVKNPTPLCNDTGGCTKMSLTISVQKNTFVVEMTIQVFLPRWSNVGSASARDQERWRLFYDDIVKHEDRHVFWFTTLGKSVGTESPAEGRTRDVLWESNMFQAAYREMMGFQHAVDAMDGRRISQQEYWDH